MATRTIRLQHARLLLVPGLCVKCLTSVDMQAPPFKFRLGYGQAIDGWDLALRSMRVGERAELLVAHDYGYGSAGLPPRIPAYALLHFELELVAAEVCSTAERSQPLW